MPHTAKTTDTLFTQHTLEKFTFNEEVASVFDDMLIRSIPYYKESQQLCIHFLRALAQKGRIYDLGCSTGNTLLALREHVEGELIGLDNSKAMITQAMRKASAYNADISFCCADIMEYRYKQARAFIANYTLQFIRPPLRTKLIKTLYNALDSQGVLILSEKVISPHAAIEAQMIACHHQFKAHNGYSNTEISTKREALENVLIPYSMQENIALLHEVGFSHVEVLSKWINFALLLAIKQ